MVQASTSGDGWFEEDWRANLSRRLGGATALSLALHVGILLVIAFVRLPQHGERPLASIEINLASLPTPPVKAVEPPKGPQKAVEVTKPAPVKSSPAPVPPAPAKAAPAPASVPAPVAVQKMEPVQTPLVPAPAPAQILKPSPASTSIQLPPAKSSNDFLRDIKGMEPLPDAPKFGDFAPTEKPKRAPMKLPDLPTPSELKEAVSAAPETKPQRSLTEDLNKELDEEFKKIKKLDLPKPVPVQTETAPPKPVPQVEAKAPSVKAVDTTLKVPGMAPGSNAYLGRVRQKISGFWSAPPVDVTAQAYVVVVKFRLHRNGSVTGVAIEQSSGNEYYDLAGKRAVVSAIPLPAFPAEITDAYFDAHFTFTVGEPQG